MKKHTLNFLLLFLRGLILFKRGGVWVGKIFYRGFEGLLGGFWRVVGFRLGKISFFLQRNFGWAKVPWQDQLGELLSRRGSLQIILLVICFFVLYPQTKLYTKDAFNSPGQKTLLYALVGPGDQDYSLEEVVYSENIVIDKSATSWKDSAVSAGASTGVGDNSTGPVDITGVSTGGLALTKPTILPGSTLPTEATVNTGRTEIVIYEVLPGDVIGQIAEKFSIDVQTILWANNLTARSYIRPGDKLKILPVSGITHTVKKGESISKIARLYGVVEAEIVKANQLQRDGSDISIGENLIIPGGKIIAPVVKRVAVVNNNSSIRQVAAPPPSVNAPAGSGYIWPTAAKIITQYFGFRHTGLDIASSKKGTPNYAARAGTVLKAQCGWNGGYGCYVIIDHGGGVQTLYGHHSQLYVSAGDKVVQGQTIGLMGSTGKSTGPHLHFEIRVNGKVQNPLKYIR